MAKEKCNDWFLRRIRKHRRKEDDMLMMCVAQQQRAIMEVLDIIVEEMTDDGNERKGGWGGPTGGSKNIKMGESSWIRDYLGTAEEAPKYPAEKFRRRFSIPRTLCRKLKADLIEYRTEYWNMRMIAGRRLRKQSDIRILSFLRMLSSGNAPDSLDDTTYMVEETGRAYFREFCFDVREIYRRTYLHRWPTATEIVEVEDKYRAEGFPGCVGCIDCMKVFWKNFPVQDKGQYLNTKDSSKLACIQAEAWCDHDLYCWNWNAGRAGTNNDLYVLARSRLYKDIISERFLFKMPHTYRIITKGEKRRTLYLLGDGIYPVWPIFVKPLKGLNDAHERTFSRKQEALRKDVERFIGVLQGRFDILRRELGMWELEDIIAVSYCCVVMHNMIVRMHQNGDFSEEAGGMNVIAEFYEEDTQRKTESAQQYENNFAASLAAIENGDLLVEADWLAIWEVAYMDAELHDRLLAELVKLTARTE